MAGRGSPETSDGYLRVARTTATEVQVDSARHIRERLLQSDLGESETLDKLRNCMLTWGFSLEVIEVQMVKLQVPHLAWREAKSGHEDLRVFQLNQEETWKMTGLVLWTSSLKAWWLACQSRMKNKHVNQSCLKSHG